MNTTPKPLTWADVVDPDPDTAAIIEDWATRQIEPTELSVTWTRFPTAENVTAFWTPEGLRVAFWTGRHGVTTLLVDEAGQQALRNALGGAS